MRGVGHLLLSRRDDALLPVPPHTQTKHLQHASRGGGGAMSGVKSSSTLFANEHISKQHYSPTNTPHRHIIRQKAHLVIQLLDAQRAQPHRALIRAESAAAAGFAYNWEGDGVGWGLESGGLV